MVSRNQKKLEDLEVQLRNFNKAKSIEVFCFDFSKNEEYQTDKVSQMFKDKNISLLINNVGETTLGGNFNFYSSQKNFSVIDTNIKPAVLLSQNFLNANCENRYENKAIINISSYFGHKSVSGMSIYSASKSFLSSIFEKFNL